MHEILHGVLPGNPSAAARGRSSRRFAAMLVGSCFCMSAWANDFLISADTSQPFPHWKWAVQTDAGPSDSNPDLTLRVGLTYTFSFGTISAAHPFYINTVQGTGSANAYPTGISSGLDHNGATSAATVMTFKVPASAIGTLYYNCGNHVEMTGVINVIDSVFAANFEIPTP
ncbi:hypothetical protein ELE36_01335 [Pseudolysobacter antarcticus]|uniref:Blue (type 1) copper domain-containing protein n=1 Tax=Pseudolysobacter antarcticus TaxID=2511995 RepID=A0A411HF78_9GAMM|nr:hypothetical protein [Pseudolysobacter antarcticus]QBB69132.1 hypothetical protein ELE36_01335 [Pseudolysobacter antarcticus]